MTVKNRDQLTADRTAPASDPPALDSAEIGYVRPRLTILGTMQKLATKFGSPKALGGSL
ncbi:hypothetical protein [Jidongwangia harbinensis]|uniref:hypothetical protein n=1 Tax=Jidongwangia harbinensis TaxID=2878561 RepID=UPI001CD9FB09|nr:hypothetical protein [Jidongwangia harbinensis]MCA2214302.1 hypothetical protein [Jidongwangia harbinensis]